MGVSEHVGADRFPKQGPWLGQKHRVCFDFDASQTFDAVCIRDDLSEPRLTIFQLENGKVVLATECQHQPMT